MNHQRVKDVRSAIARICGQTGQTTTDAAVILYLNRAVQELLAEGDWPGVVDRYTATALDGHFVLPDEFESVELMSVNRQNQPVRHGAFEFLAYGPGQQDDGHRSMGLGAVDRGNTTVFTNIPAPNAHYLRLTSDRTEVSTTRALIRGWDENGKRIRTTDESSGGLIDGLYLPLPGSIGVPAQTTIKVSKVDTRPGSVVIPSDVEGELTFSAYDPTGDDDVILAVYPPGVEVPQFRRYYMPSATPGVEHTLVVRAFRKFKPVSKDDDILLVSHLPALETMVLALREKDNANLAEYYNIKKLAVSELTKATERYHAANTGVQVRTDFGFGFGGDDGVR